jgi:hypothetical protein
MKFIDYSQYKNWCKCPWAWYNRYVAGYQKIRPGQQRDAMTLGSLVHNGLHNHHEKGVPVISEATIESCQPTPDCLDSANLLVQEYVRLYPNEEFEIQGFEEPLVWELPCSGDLHGLAKVDAYFYNPTQCEIETGLPDQIMSLEPGWWLREYKTKDASIDRAKWNAGWTANMQANFQMLALAHKIGEPVKGVIVSVLEKPRVYIPKRKCKGCGEQIEMALYLTAPDGQSSCPMCGTIQMLKEYEPKVRAIPQFYRTRAIRTPEELVCSEYEIVKIAKAMDQMRERGQEMSSPNRESCVHTIFGLCEFYNTCVNHEEMETDPWLEKRDPTKYVELERMVSDG